MATSSLGNFPRVIIIVLNWNNAPATIRILNLLNQLTYPCFEVVVVDNASTDNSVEMLQAQFSNLQLLKTTDNLGYAGGNNCGIRQAMKMGAKYIGIINNDIIPSAKFLESLVKGMQLNSEVGVATPLIAEVRNSDRVWMLGGAVDKFSGEVRRLGAGDLVEVARYRPVTAVDVASGAAMLVKSEVFEKVGLLDEDFFLYYEECDWCIQVRRAGYQIVAVPSSLVWHEVSDTLGVNSPIIDYYMVRNQVRFIARNWTGTMLAMLATRVFVRQVLAILAFTLNSHEGKRTPHRNARILALRDVLLNRWGQMGKDVTAVCHSVNL